MIDSVVRSSDYPGSYGPSASRVAEHFGHISNELRATDARLERDEYNRTEPGHNWAGWFRNASDDLSRATREFSDVTRGDYSSNDIARRLDREVYNLRDRGQQIADMDYRNSHFGYGWGSVLDNAINAVDDAIRELRYR